jgi:hypothetical protein
VSPVTTSRAPHHVAVQRIEIDGLPVFTAAGPERVTAALMFGVGLRDETFATVGVTHLIEHLVMGTLPKSHLQSNAMVDIESTVFYATGRPDAVRGFVEAICRAVSDLPTDRMPLEIGVLQAENCAGSHPTVAALLGARYGLRGPGLTVTAGGAGPEFLTETVVRDHARRWFVRENAALVWHGPLPEGLSLRLPSGPRPHRPVPEPCHQTGPFWTGGPVFDGAGLLLSGPPRDPALSVAVGVLEERMSDVARHARGLSYSAGVEVVDSAPDRRDVALYVDAREGKAGEVARLLWEQYWSLSGEGPSADEVAHVVAGMEAELDGDVDEFVRGELSAAARCEIERVPFRPAREILELWRTVTPEQAAAALRATRGTAILALPEGVELLTALDAIGRRFFCGIVPQLPAGAVFRPSALKRLNRGMRRLQLVVADVGLGHRDEDGDDHFIAWPDVEAVIPLENGDGFVVIGRNMCTVPVVAELFGRTAVETVRASIPAELFMARPTPLVASPVTVPVG